MMPPGSPVLGAALIQESQPLAYAIRAPSEPKTGYANIEKEILTIVFAFER